MFHRRPTEAPVSRGQALVEFALILPILALLLVVAVDFGRVFFGWVSLTNAARIGANYAGYTPDLMTNAAKRAEYGALIQDAVTGCTLAPTSMSDPAYDPRYSDGNGDTSDGNNGWGDLVTVNISCQLHLITPLAGAIVGQNVPMRAEAVFPIRQGVIGGPGGGGTPPDPPCTQKLIPDLLNRTVAEARLKWESKGFLAANFSPPPGSSEDYLVNSQTFTPAANVQDCVDPLIQHVTITSVAPPPCPSGQAQVPDLIGLLVSQAKTTWAASFSGAFKPTNAVDSKTVLTQSTSPAAAPPINGCAPVSAVVTVTYGDPPAAPCAIPNMIGLTLSEAEAIWLTPVPPATKGFTNPLQHQGQVNKRVAEQTPNHPGTVSCTVIGTVKLQ